MSGRAVVTAARRYRALFAAPGVARVAWPSLIGRLPYGMSTLLFVLAVHHGTGSYTLAGIATAANSAVTAFTAPWLGRMCDRGHARIVLILTGSGYAAVLIGLLFALTGRAGPWVIVALCGLSGALNPPIGAVTRAVLPGLAPEHAPTAYALDAIGVELTFVLGPAIIAAVSAFFSTPYPAVALTGALALGGALGLAFAPGLSSRYAAVKAASPSGTRQPLMGLCLAVIVVIGALEAAAYGVMEVAIPAYAQQHGVPQAAGALVAAWSAGSIAGGIWFSGMNPRLSLPRLFALLLGLNTVGFSAMLLATGLTDLGLILFLGGLVIAPTTAVEAALVTAIAPAARATEAFTWSGTGIYVGFAIGAAVSGTLIGHGVGIETVNFVAVGMVLLGASLALSIRRKLDDR